jgi:hypothetical protein
MAAAEMRSLLGVTMLVGNFEIALGVAPRIKSGTSTISARMGSGHGSRGCCRNEVTSFGGAIPVRHMEIGLIAGPRTMSLPNSELGS